MAVPGFLSSQSRKIEGKKGVTWCGLHILWSKTSKTFGRNYLLSSSQKKKMFPKKCKVQDWGCSLAGRVLAWRVQSFEFGSKVLRKTGVVVCTMSTTLSRWREESQELMVLLGCIVN